MTVLVVGMSHRTAPVSRARAVARRRRRRCARRWTSCTAATRQRGAGAVHLQPDRGLRRRRPLPRRRRRHQPRARPARRADRGRAVRAPRTCTTRTRRPSTCSPSPSGLDSMVVGESQILGQLRAALRARRGAGTVGRALHDLAQHALRVGKRVHAETGIDRAGASLVSVALDRAAAAARRRSPGRARARRRRRLDGRARRRHAAPGAASTELVVANRTRERAERLAADARRPGQCAWTTSPSWPGDRRRRRRCLLHRRHRAGRSSRTLIGPRGPTGRWPCSTWPCRGTSTRPSPTLPGVHLVDLDALRPGGAARRATAEIDAATTIVAEELRPYLGRAAASSRSRRPSPRCAARPPRSSTPSCAASTPGCPTSTTRSAGEVADTVRRVVDKLLHAPTVRVKELAAHARRRPSTPTRCASCSSSTRAGRRGRSRPSVTGASR